MPEPNSRVERPLVAFLERLSSLSRGHALDTLAATDLTLTQMKVTFALDSAGGSLSVNEIAECIDLSLAATGRAVEKLVGLGFVDRREDADDRRIKRVSLTDKGIEFVESHLSVRDELVSQFVSGLPEPLRDGLNAALTPIVDSDVDYFDLTSIPARPTEKDTA